MNQKVDVCIQCKFPRPVNSKGVCPECVFKNNHNGKNQQEVYLERFKLKEQQQPIKIYVEKRKPIKLRKKIVINGQLRDERLRKRIDQINEDEKTYEEVFNSRPNECEECRLNNIYTPLPNEFRNEEGFVIFKTQYSHILGKKAFPEFRNDSRNFNRLCFECHQRWDFGDKEKMKIYEKNQIIIQELLDEKNNKIGF